MEQEFTREEIRQNRLKFAAGLQESHREKITGLLEDGENSNKRCCLGHGCDIFSIKRGVKEGTGFIGGEYVAINIIEYGEELNDAVAPEELITLLGLRNPRGGTGVSSLDTDVTPIYGKYTSLTSLNDKSELTPQDIGELIEGWIEGGEGTPFLPLSNYKEE